MIPTFFKTFFTLSRMSSLTFFNDAFKGNFQPLSIVFSSCFHQGWLSAVIVKNVFKLFQDYLQTFSRPTSSTVRKSIVCVGQSSAFFFKTIFNLLFQDNLQPSFSRQSFTLLQEHIQSFQDHLQTSSMQPS